MSADILVTIRNNASIMFNNEDVVQSGFLWWLIDAKNPDGVEGYYACYRTQRRKGGDYGGVWTLHIMTLPNLSVIEARWEYLGISMPVDSIRVPKTHPFMNTVFEAVNYYEETYE